jgi:hypothetical protein
MEAKIIQCARCEEDHETLEFSKFRRPMIDDNGTAWSHWAMCPIENAPILLRVTKEDAQQGREWLMVGE